MLQCSERGCILACALLNVFNLMLLTATLWQSTRLLVQATRNTVASVQHQAFLTSWTCRSAGGRVYDEKKRDCTQSQGSMRDMSGQSLSLLWCRQPGTVHEWESHTELLGGSAVIDMSNRAVALLRRLRIFR